MTAARGKEQLLNATAAALPVPDERTYEPPLKATVMRLSSLKGDRIIKACPGSQIIPKVRVGMPHVRSDNDAMKALQRGFA